MMISAKMPGKFIIIKELRVLKYKVALNVNTTNPLNQRKWKMCPKKSITKFITLSFMSLSLSLKNMFYVD